jgi:hypothetical protein
MMMMMCLIVVEAVGSGAGVGVGAGTLLALQPIRNKAVDRRIAHRERGIKGVSPLSCSGGEALGF